MYMDNKTKSLIFDFTQFSSIIFFVFTGPLISSNLIIWLFQLLSLFLILSAVWQMRRTKFYRVPDVGKQRELVTSGIYSYIRNPMYTSQILFLTSLLSIHFSLSRLIVLLIFTVNFLYKIKYEEELLKRHFPKFMEYLAKTARLLPYIY